MVAKEGDQPKERQAAQARKKILDEELARYIRLLKEHGPPEKVILFGTLAGGQVHEWSDIERSSMNTAGDRWLEFARQDLQMAELEQIDIYIHPHSLP